MSYMRSGPTSSPWVAHRGERFDAYVYVKHVKDGVATTIQVYAEDHSGVCHYSYSVGSPYPAHSVGPITGECHWTELRSRAYFSVCCDYYAGGCPPEWRTTDGSRRATTAACWLSLLLK
jgi:hypothetical protein